jgi:DNA-binding transcriptional LysR family regulator
MNLGQLRYFLTIADEGSFTRAAEQLLVAQPSLFQQIKALEHELGGPLLERLPKGVRLTAPARRSCPRPARLSRTPTAPGETPAARWDSKPGSSRWPG